MAEHGNGQRHRGHHKEPSGGGGSGLFSERWSIRLWLLILALCFGMYWILLHLFLHNDHPNSSFTSHQMSGKELVMSKGVSPRVEPIAATPSVKSSATTITINADVDDTIAAEAGSETPRDAKTYRPHMGTSLQTSRSNKRPLSAVLRSIPDPAIPGQPKSPEPAVTTSRKASSGVSNQKSEKTLTSSSTSSASSQVVVVDKSDRQAVYYMEDDEEGDDVEEEDADKALSKPKKDYSSSSSGRNRADSSSNNQPKSQAQLNRERSIQKQRKNQHRFSAGKLFNHEPEWGYNNELPYIQVLSTLKIPLKKDRRVVFQNLSFSKPSRDLNEPPSGVVGTPRELLKANAVLQTHPLYQATEWFDGSKRLEDTMQYIQQSSYCVERPIFLSMATVGDDLYWQLIENFVYSAVKFNVSQCALVICVSDVNCMKMCESAYFPCYNYQEELRPLPSVMEQIARVKLFHVPKALSMGVNVFMLDLDVGFLSDPQHMLKAFYATPIVDVMVQEDYIFIMNRSTVGWKQWFTEPLPNIGLFLCRGNNKTAKIFEISWEKYKLMDDAYEKAQPGRDQNHVLDAMRIGRGEFGLKYAYFSNTTAPLLDKLVLNYGTVMELGGELMQNFLLEKHSIAMHATCYEKSTKVMGLKAANAFWNPRYYDPLRKTITKPILFTDEASLLDEVRSLIWLAMETERSLILPNILGAESIRTVAKYKNQSLWPGFRITFLKRSNGRNELKVNLLEPGYYWRVNRDYDAIPDPTFIFFDTRFDSLMTIKTRVAAASLAPRIVLHHSLLTRRNALQPFSAADEEQLRVWANDSIGLFPKPYSELILTYKAIPSVKGIRTVPGVQNVNEVLQGMRTCAYIFGPHRGNRTCFQVCD